jgi:hypothetical protein
LKSNALKKAAAMTLVFVLGALIQACDESQMMVIMSFMMGMMGGNGAAFGGMYGNSSTANAALMGSSMSQMYSAANNSGNGTANQSLEAYLRSNAFRQTATQGYTAYQNGQSAYPQQNQTYTAPQYSNPSVRSDATRSTGLGY